MSERPDTSPPVHTLAAPLERLEEWLAQRRVWILVSLMVAALGLRGVMALELINSPFLYVHEWPQSDMNTFDQWARSIVAGNIWSRDVSFPYHEWHQQVAEQYALLYPEPWAKLMADCGNDPNCAGKKLWDHWCGGGRLFQEPLYPYFVAAIYRLAGPDVLPIFALQLLFGVASIGLIYWIARRYFGDLVGLLTALLLLLCPTPMFYEFALLRDAPLIFFGLIALWLGQRALESPGAMRLLCAGFWLGLCLMMKGHFAILTLLTATLIGWRWRSEPRRVIAYCLIFLAGLAVGYSPLIARNLVVGAPPLSAASGVAPTFINANAGRSDYVAWKIEYVAPIMGNCGTNIPCVIGATVQSHPTWGSVAALVAEKIFATFYWYEEPNNANFQYAQQFSGTLAFSPISFGILAPLMLVGLVLAAKRPGLGLLYANFAMALAVLLLFFVFDRFRIQLAYAGAPFAAYTIVRLADWSLQRRWGRLAAAVAPLVLISLHSLSPMIADQVRVRFDDYNIGHQLFFDRRARNAANRLDWRSAAAVIREEIDLQPPFVRQLDPRRGPLGDEQAHVVEFFGQLYSEYANLLMEAKEPALANAAAARSEQLLQSALHYRAATQPAMGP